MLMSSGAPWALVAILVTAMIALLGAFGGERTVSGEVRDLKECHVSDIKEIKTSLQKHESRKAHPVMEAIYTERVREVDERFDRLDAGQKAILERLNR